MNRLLTYHPVSRSQALRHFSMSRVCAAVCWPKPDYGPMEVCRSDFLNGLRVAAAKPEGSQIAAVTIMFQVGSRLEYDHQLGATHFIRTATTASGSGLSGFMRIRLLQEHGAYITCNSDRQSIAFTLRCPPPSFCDLYCYFIDIATRGIYRQIELEDKVKPLIRDDLMRRQPEQHVIDMVQKACWGGPLNNSVYCSWGRVGSMTQETLEEFTRQYFTTNLCTIGSVGIPFEDTFKLAEHIECGKVDRPRDLCQTPSFPRSGFETLDLGDGSDTWIAVAVPGCGTYNLGCLMKHAILAAAMGTGNIMTGSHKYNNIRHCPLGVVAHECFTEFKAFNISYYDTGVFGIVVRTKAEAADYAAMAAVEFLTNIHELSCDQVLVGKKRLKVSLTCHDDNAVKVAEGLALQIASNHKMDSARDAIQMIDDIPPEQVVCVAREIASKRKQMAVAIVGDVGAAPDTGTLLCHGYRGF